MILRELVAVFGIDVDKKGFQEAKGGLDSIKSALANIGIGIGVGAITAGLIDVTRAASDANESLNVATQSFGDYSQQVIDWSKATGQEVGRSSAQLIRMAGELGGLLTPMLGGNRKQSAEMSQTLSKLAVDLGSFFNMADDEALTRLRSGLTGSKEAVEILGISIGDATLQEFARTKGITKSTQQMTEQEKMMLRYEKILKDTADKQGDAARTAGGYANMTKRLEANILDLKIGMGSIILGPMTDIVGLLSDMAVGMKEVFAKSKLFEAALITLGALLTPFAIQFALASLPMIAFAAGLILVALAIEDIWGALEGRESLIGDIFTALIGEENWKLVVHTWTGYMKALGNLFYDLLHGVDNAWGRFADNMAAIYTPEALRKATGHASKAPAPPPPPPPPGGGPWAPIPQKPVDVADYAPALLKGLQYVSAPVGTMATAAAQGAANMVVNVYGNPDKNTLREVERTARRVQDDQNRNTVRTAGSGKGGPP
jgi:hypothetical protein